MGDEARDLGLTKVQVTEIVGQGKELYSANKYSQGRAHVCTGEPRAVNDPFIICV